MKLIHLISRVILYVFFTSVNPNLFGSAKRRKDKEGIAGEFKSMADNTQSRIDELRTQNPFESAWAKNMWGKASRTSKQMLQKNWNILGNQATPEALVGLQGAANQALGSAAGQIAVGAEAQKENQINNLERLKTGQMGMYGNMKASAAEERGSGWGTLFQGIDSLGSLASGAGQGASAVLSAV